LAVDELTDILFSEFPESLLAAGGTPGLQQEDVTILDRFNNTAVSRLSAQILLTIWKRQRSIWKIVNVLWEPKKPPTAEELNTREGRK
jgi:hypothetical protein